VVLTGGRAELMRWGFERPWSKSINNARADKLTSPMWKESIETRRCLIPMDGFFEYSGPAGHKQAHWFHSPSGGWLWGAGIWEPHQDLGPCYSMIMTEATGIVTPIHDRMPVLIAGEDAEQYLTGDSDGWTFHPVALAVEKAENPSKLPSRGRRARSKGSYSASPCLQCALSGGRTDLTRRRSDCSARRRRSRWFFSGALMSSLRSSSSCSISRQT